MDSMTCPKCGEPEVVRCMACCLSWECDACGATSSDEHNHQRAVFEKLIQWQKEQLAAMTARAEKAEAEVKRSHAMLAKLYRRRMEWVQVTMESGTYRCTLCGNMQEHGCSTSCPTITHPVEVEP
jgi:uncharacterized tellurite resistance protein B-like protein